MLVIDHFHDAQQNVHWYHVGGSSDPAYQDFYQWLRTVRLHYDYTDMPHHNFVLLRETDRRIMHEKFAAYLAEMQRETFHRGEYVDLIAPVDPNSPEVIMQSALREAIQEEIDKDIQRLLWFERR